ncbi:error-prone DNA polymerase [Paracoccus nototheniae]|uniref:Error-prone DNA polymerase n=1 Tax=Paracoccus nototheniae TaxID=2489002 RepID=A0ABW4E1A1_9RHOB
MAAPDISGPTEACPTGACPPSPGPAYAELCVTTNFTFLTGASHPEELVTRAAELGLTAIAITDRNSVAGVVRAFSALKELTRLRDEALAEAGAAGAEGGMQAGRDAETERGTRTEGSAQEGSAQAGGEQAGGGPQAERGMQAGNGTAPGHAATRKTAPNNTGPKSDGPKSDGPKSDGPKFDGPKFDGPKFDGQGKTGQGPVIRSRQITDHSSRQTRAQPSEATAPFPPDQPLPRLIAGARLVLTDSAVEWLALPTDLPAWSRLTRLLSVGKRRAAKGQCHIVTADLMDWGQGLILIARPPDPLASPLPDSLLPDSPLPDSSMPDSSMPGSSTPADSGPADSGPGDPRPAQSSPVSADIARMAQAFPGCVYLGAAPGYDGQDQARLDRMAGLAQATGAPLVAVGDVLMHRASRRPMADVLSCLRLGCTIHDLGLRRLPNAERRLKDGADMMRLFHRHPQALARTLDIAARCTFRLDDLRYHYPDEALNGEPAQDRLARLAAAGLRWRYPKGAPEDMTARVDKELGLIAHLGYAPYFLTVHDIVAFARSRGILCQGRGSAANSVICYLLGITEVPPESITLIFERFISRERGEPPDIDVDFEHERREEVIQHIYDRYGRDRAGLTATVIHFRARAAIREVGKVMGLGQDVLAAMSGQIWGFSSDAPKADRLRAAGLDPDDPHLAMTLRLVAEITGFPRHLSQHVGGFVITHGRLDELCPIENAAMQDRTVIEWDKDDIDALGLMKVDVLALGMLTAIRKAFGLLVDHEGVSHDLASIPQRDATVYDMLCRADAVGVFQVESRAQLNFLPRMRPRNLYDLVCEVAIVRPGPIQGGMVHPYLARRRGLEPVEDLGPALNKVLARTYGVPLFQEQAMQIAVVGAGFTPAEADKLRRSLATFKRMGTIGGFRDRFVTGMLQRGYDEDFARRCFAQIEGFGSYGFPESHAASFARLVYISAWLKRHHQAVFTCALLNSQPMGFYAPAQLVRDARDRGVEVRPVCINLSAWDNRLERRTDGTLALRLGFRQIKGLRAEDAVWIIAARANGYPDVESVWRRAGVRPDTLERLAEGDAFTALGLPRREALWAARALRAPRPLPLFGADGEGGVEPAVHLPQMSLGEAVIEDYLSLRLSLRAHPLAILRPGLPESLPHDRLAHAAPGRVTVTGLVITRQRPGTASGVIFLTLEDETGVSNVVVWSRVYETFRSAVVAGRLLRVRGRIERDGPVVHVIAETIEDLSARLTTLGRPTMIQSNDGRADETRRPVVSRGGAAQHPRTQAGRLFPSRDFH